MSVIAQSNSAEDSDEDSDEDEMPLFVRPRTSQKGPIASTIIPPFVQNGNDDNDSLLQPDDVEDEDSDGDSDENSDEDEMPLNVRSRASQKSAIASTIISPFIQNGNEDNEPLKPPDDVENKEGEESDAEELDKSLAVEMAVETPHFAEEEEKKKDPLNDDLIKAEMYNILKDLRVDEYVHMVNLCKQVSVTLECGFILLMCKVINFLKCKWLPSNVQFMPNKSIFKRFSADQPMPSPGFQRRAVPIKLKIMHTPEAMQMKIQTALPVATVKCKSSVGQPRFRPIPKRNVKVYAEVYKQPATASAVAMQVSKSVCEIIESGTHEEKQRLLTELKSFIRSAVPGHHVFGGSISLSVFPRVKNPKQKDKFFKYTKMQELETDTQTDFFSRIGLL